MYNKKQWNLVESDVQKRNDRYTRNEKKVNEKRENTCGSGMAALQEDGRTEILFLYVNTSGVIAMKKIPVEPSFLYIYTESVQFNDSEGIVLRLWEGTRKSSQHPPRFLTLSITWKFFGARGSENAKRPEAEHQCLRSKIEAQCVIIRLRRVFYTITATCTPTMPTRGLLVVICVLHQRRLFRQR